MGFDLLPRYPARAAGPFHFNGAGWHDLMNGPVGAVIGTEPTDEPNRCFEADRKGRSPRRNEGFYVTATKARAMTRAAREWIAEERTRGVQPEAATDEALPTACLVGMPFKPFVEQVDEFAAWAERSGGFWIY